MSTELPLYRQEKHNTCALACLRMVLAACGTHVEESTLERQARMEPDGTSIDELLRLAHRYNLVAEIQEITVAELRHLLAGGKLLIAYIDRAVFELRPGERLRHSLRHAKIHTVVPTRMTTASITFHDPLGPRVSRKSIGLFEQAYGKLGNHCVVCSNPDN